MKRFFLHISACYFVFQVIYRLKAWKNIEQRLTDYFINYQTSYANIGTCKLDHFTVDHEHKTLQVYANDNFGYQPFTEENTQAIYRSLKQLLPGPVNYYRITLYADGQPIEI